MQYPDANKYTNYKLQDHIDFTNFRAWLNKNLPLEETITSAKKYGTAVGGLLGASAAISAAAYLASFIASGVILPALAVFGAVYSQAGVEVGGKIGATIGEHMIKVIHGIPEWEINIPANGATLGKELGLLALQTALATSVSYLSSIFTSNKFARTVAKTYSMGEFSTRAAPVISKSPFSEFTADIGTRAGNMWVAAKADENLNWAYKETCSAAHRAKDYLQTTRVAEFSATAAAKASESAANVQNYFINAYNKHTESPADDKIAKQRNAAENRRQKPNVSK